MLITTSYQLTPDELRRALKQISGGRGLKIGWTITAGLLLAAAYFLTTGAVLLGVGFGSWGVVGVLSLTRGVRKFAEQKAERQCKPTEVSFSEEAFLYRSPTSSEEHRWQRFLKTEETAEFFLLFAEPRRAIPIPKRAFDAAELAQVRALLSRVPATARG